jgi:hypothetical protein
MRPFVASSSLVSSGSRGPQNVKEQARERLTYSTLPCLEGNATWIIQCFFVPSVLPSIRRQESVIDGAPSRRDMGGAGLRWFLAVFDGIASTILCVADGFANPKGIEAFSPGLRGTSYPG